MTEVGILSVGISVPSKILSNSDLEKIVDTSDEWITTRTGIKERHILQPHEKISTFVSEAAKIACEKAEIPPAELDLVISSTLTPDRISPAQAFEVAHDLNINNAFCFDLNGACSGFIYAISVADSMLKTRPIKYGLVSAGEQLTRTANYTDRNSCVLFGDAAAAVVLTNQNPKHRILYTELGSDPSMANEVTVGGINDLLSDRKNDYYFRQNGKVVFKFAVSKMKELIESVPQKAGIKPEKIKYVIPHQANARIIDSAAENCIGNPRFISVIDKYGNTSSASIGLALNNAWSYFEKGDYILLIGFGAGLSWGAALVEW